MARSNSDKIRFRSPSDAAGFTIASNLALFDGRLSDGAHRTYLALIHYARQDNNCFPRQETLMRDRSVSKRTLQVQLKELKDLGLIEVEQRGTGLSNIYWISSLDEVYASSNATPLKANSPDYRKAQDSAHQEVEASSDDEKAKESSPGKAQDSALPLKGVKNKQTEEETTTTTSSASHASDENGQEENSSVVASLLVDQMCSIGVTRVVAEGLVVKYSVEEIRNQLRWLPYRKAIDGAAVFYKSLTFGWAAPARALEVEREATNRLVREEVERRKREESAAREAAGALEDRLIAKLWDSLSGEDRARVDAAAIAELNELRGIKRGGLVWEQLVESKRRAILRRMLLDQSGEG